MYLNAFILFNFWPTSFKFILHITPYLSRLIIELVHFVFGLLFEHIESVFALDDCSFKHEEFELLKSRICLVPTPGCLNLDYS